MKYIKNIFPLIITIVLLFFTTYNLDDISTASTSRSLFNDCWHIIQDNYYLKDLNNQNWSYWKKHYKNKIKDLDDAGIAIGSMIASLNDEYSKYMNNKEFLAQNQAINSQMNGLGISVAMKSDGVNVVDVIKNSPAYNSGVKKGDIIVKIDNKNINHIQSAIQSIKENDGIIKLELSRKGRKLTKNIKKEIIKLETISYELLKDNIGYIKLSSFVCDDTRNKFKDALLSLQNSKALILDLRGNSGGLLENALEISSMFLPYGDIVTIVAQDGSKETYCSNGEHFIYNNPVVILVNGLSASASEVLSGALKDNKKAILIGTRTFGKGLIQKVFFFKDENDKIVSGMNLTIARYLTPNGVDINKKGIEPDYRIELTNSYDSQLAYAKKYINSLEQ